MIMRTESENKAYIDGYNHCFDSFVEMLKSKKDIDKAIKKMELLKVAVNNAAIFYGQRKGDDEDVR